VLVKKSINVVWLLLIMLDYCFGVKIGSYSVEAYDYLGNEDLTKSRLAT